jgi:predicted enzyme related to lactoylglutathione lyase
MSHRVIHFEFGCESPERAAKFYQDVFDWKIEKWPGPTPYWLAATGPESDPGINGGLLRHPDGRPRTIISILVDSIEDAAEKVRQNGGKMEIPKMTIPGVGYLGYCIDTEGNLFGIFQPDPQAK